MLEVSKSQSIYGRIAEVLQPWITPSIFEATNNDDIVDEFTLGQLTNTSYASQVLQAHWQSWISDDDFTAIAAAGLTHVRCAHFPLSVVASSNEDVFAGYHSATGLFR